MAAWVTKNGEWHKVVWALEDTVGEGRVGKLDCGDNDVDRSQGTDHEEGKQQHTTNSVAHTIDASLLGAIAGAGQGERGRG